MTATALPLKSDDFDVQEPKTPSKLTLAIAEFLGTTILVFIGCMGCITKIVDLPVVPHFPGFTYGLAVLISLQVIGHISGCHINPQVSLGAVIYGQLKLILLPIYVTAQMLGGLAGIGLLKLLTPKKYGEGMCVTMPQEQLNVVQALFVEVTITFILVLVCCGVWDKRNAKLSDSTPLRFGFIVSGLAMVAGPYTGASMNSARSFGPALIANSWEHHWIYWVGPTMGSVIGAVFYRYLLNPPK